MKNGKIYVFWGKCVFIMYNTKTKTTKILSSKKFAQKVQYKAVKFFLTNGRIDRQTNRLTDRH